MRAGSPECKRGHHSVLPMLLRANKPLQPEFLLSSRKWFLAVSGNHKGSKGYTSRNYCAAALVRKQLTSMKDCFTEEDRQYVSDSIRTIPDFPKKGIMFHDVTSMLLDPKVPDLPSPPFVLFLSVRCADAQQSTTAPVEVTQMSPRYQ